jgi:hypothetical protein
VLNKIQTTNEKAVSKTSRLQVPAQRFPLFPFEFAHMLRMNYHASLLHSLQLCGSMPQKK